MNIIFISYYINESIAYSIMQFRRYYSRSTASLTCQHCCYYYCYFSGCYQYSLSHHHQHHHYRYSSKFQISYARFNIAIYRSTLSFDQSISFHYYCCFLPNFEKNLSQVRTLLMNSIQLLLQNFYCFISFPLKLI